MFVICNILSLIIYIFIWHLSIKYSILFDLSLFTNERRENVKKKKQKARDNDKS